MSIIIKKQQVITHGFFFFALLYIILLKDLAFPLKTLLKPLPILFLIFAIRGLNLQENKWSALLWALVFSLAGDIALTFDGTESFLAGIVFFAFAHLSYTYLFFEKLELNKTNTLTIMFLSLGSIIVFRLLYPYLGELKVPVILYSLILLTMVSTAQLNTSISPLTKIGTLLFIASDGVLALHAFKPSSLYLTPVVMTTYYLAQFFIVRGLSLKPLEVRSFKGV